MFDHEIGLSNEISYPDTHDLASQTWAKIVASRPKVLGLETGVGTSRIKLGSDHVSN